MGNVSYPMGMLADVTPLQRLRLKMGLTLQEIAEPLSTSRGQISKIERFQTEPPAKVRTRYAVLLGITVAQLGEIVYDGRANLSRRPRKRRG